MDNKPLHIPKTKKLKGLKVHCYECGTTVDSVCKKDGVPIANCKHGADHVFKAYAHVPGSENGRKTKTLSTRSLDEARRLTLEFQEEIKNIPVEPTVKIILPEIQKEKTQTEQSSEEDVLKYNLLEQMSLYVGFMHADPELVPEHRRKERGKDYLIDIERTLRYFKIALESAKFEFHKIRIDTVSEKMVGAFHSYLLNTRHFSPSSYNRAMSIMTSFYTHLTQEGYPVRNPFVVVERKPTNPNKEVVKKNEYEQLLDIIQKPELGISTLKTGERKNLFKSWMKDAVEIGVTTGRRIEEITFMKWCDIICDEKGEPLYIKTPDYKVNRQKRLTGENRKFRYSPINEDLFAVLERLGYDREKDSEKFILAPEEKMQRQTIRRFITRSFTHYCKQLNLGRKLTFKNLRKTFITQLSAQRGIDNAQIITGHSGQQVMKDHYIDERVISETAKSFRLYKEDKDQDEEIERSRRSKDDMSIDI